MSDVDAQKVLIYATSIDGLLVFEEPEFPEIDIQVPGGTVEEGEDVATAALREFHEETGLEAPRGMRFLGVVDYSFERNGRTVKHRRHYFHTLVSGQPVETWTHVEQSPYDGGKPILFRLFWIPIEEARVKLGYGMAEGLALLYK